MSWDGMGRGIGRGRGEERGEDQEEDKRCWRREVRMLGKYCR